MFLLYVMRHDLCLAIFPRLGVFKIIYLLDCCTRSYFCHEESLAVMFELLVTAHVICYLDQRLNPNPLHGECEVLALGPQGWSQDLES